MWLSSSRSLCHYETCHFHFPCIDYFFLSLCPSQLSSFPPSLPVPPLSCLLTFLFSSLAPTFLGFIMLSPYFHVNLMFPCSMFHTEFSLASVLASSPIWLFVLILYLLPFCLSAYLFLNNSNSFLHSVARCSSPRGLTDLSSRNNQCN